ncbi:MAG: hypothetical protein K6T65_00710 [Peptococcaceae bacterium]|nr:hypothetical protein [Peptococcaceae bacterium]
MHDFIDPIMPGGIVGNGRMLCSIRSDGSLHRLFWPHIDWGQHMGILKLGLQDQGRPVLWLDGDGFRYRQFYRGDTNIFTTEMRHHKENIDVSQTDFVLPEKDILVRVFNLANTGPATRSFNLIAYCSFSIEESGLHDGMYYFSSRQALVQFRRDVYLGLKCPGKTPYGFHCGRRNSPSDPYDAAGRGEFWGSPDNIKSGAGALGWSIGQVGPGERVTFSLILAAAHSEGSLAGLLDLPLLREPAALLAQTSAYWEGWLPRPNGQKTPGTKLYKRSLLAVKLMSDRTSGASVAAPEFDSHYIASGGYGYCWPRDGMFAAMALDEAGHHQEAGMFYRFAARVQNPDGSWHQRYFMNGNRAPTWGQQIDQAGAVLWGYYHHFSLAGDKKFLNDIWPSTYSGAGYLVNNRLPENGLPIPSMDIWEDEFAQSTYASAAVYGGLKGAAALAAAMGDKQAQKQWREAAESLKKSILSRHWRAEMGTFTRSVNRRVCEWDYRQAVERGQEASVIQLPCAPYSYHALTVDRRLDIALLGLCFPYNVLPASDPRMQSTASAIENSLTNRQAGGLHRYEGDAYAGGNPWVLATLWMSIFRSLQGDRDSAVEYLKWAEANSSPAGLLPEQVHRHSGGPAWVLPLTWSHAMYILASLAVSGGLRAVKPGFGDWE